MPPFLHVHFRTSDVEAARCFYVAVLGDGAVDIMRLHEQAVVRGARPHGLGYLDVANVDGMSAAFANRRADARVLEEMRAPGRV